jgi:D-glycero-D-manno-heptose 1,7-bisphosphate phosphatase
MDVRAVLLDRDGVMNEDLPRGVLRLEDFRLLPGVLEALASLARARIPAALVTNQANVGRGLVARATVEAIHERLAADVRAGGGELLSVHVCFHGPDDGCACRKPAPGLLLEAARKNGFDLARTALVGDDVRDLEAAHRAGALAVLLRTGKGRSTEERVRRGEVKADAVFDDLSAFVASIVSK